MDKVICKYYFDISRTYNITRKMMITAPEGWAKINLEISNIYMSWRTFNGLRQHTPIKGSPQATGSI